MFVSSIGIINNQKAGIDDPRGGVEYEFTQYQDFNSILAEDSVLKNLTEKGFTASNVLAWFEKGFEKSANDINHCYTVSMGISEETDLGITATLWCELNDYKTAEEIVKSEPLTYPASTTKIADVSGTIVYYSYRNIEDWNGFNVAFQIGVDSYQMSFFEVTDEKLILSFVERLLSGR